MPDTKLTWFNIKEHIRKFLWVYIAVIAATLVAGNLLWISTAPRVPEEQRVLIQQWSKLSDRDRRLVGELVDALNEKG